MESASGGSEYHFQVVWLFSGHLGGKSVGQGVWLGLHRWGEGVHRARVPSVGCHEGGGFGRLQEAVVGGKLTSGEQRYPVVLLVVDVGLQVLLHDCIHVFRLAICLWVIGS